MISRRSTILALAASAAFVPQALAHSPAPKADVSDVTKQLMQFREEMKAAIEAKDITKLKVMYADSFTHINGKWQLAASQATRLPVAG